MKKLAKDKGIFEKIIRDQKLWGFAAHKDAFVRRSVYKLLRTLLERQRGTFDASWL